MSLPGAGADDLLHRARTLEDAARATADVVARLAEAWTDATGLRWADHLRRVGDDLARAARDLVADPDGSPGTDDPRAGAPSGIVLGAQTGGRTTARRGMVVPTLPPN